MFTAAEAAEKLRPLIDWSRVPRAAELTAPANRLSVLCEHLRQRERPRMLFDLCDRDAAARHVRREHPEQAERFILEGERRMTAIGSRRRGVYLQDLAFAYILTGREEYVARGLELADADLPRLCDDDGSVRVALKGTDLEASGSLLSMLHFFGATRDAAAWTDASVGWFLYMMVDRLRYLAAPHASQFLWHNIYLANVSARHRLAVSFPELAGADAVAADTLEQLETAAALQARPDGTQVEQSPSYHCVSLWHLAWPAVLRQRNGLSVSDGYVDTIRRMARAVQAWQSPAGRVPPVSDSFPVEVPHALALPSLCLPDVRLREAEPSAADHLTLPTDLLAADGGQPPTEPLPKDVALPDGGYYVMRSGWSPGHVYLIFDAGPTGYYHGHLDLFSVHMLAGPRELLPEPGPYPYLRSPEEYGARATALHNTVCLDGYSHRPYEAEDEPLAHVTQWEPQADGAVLLSAHHTAYDHLWGRPTVRRQIYFDGKGLFVIADRVDCEREGAALRPHALIANYALPGAETAEIDEETGTVRTVFEDGPNLFLQVLNRSELTHFNVSPTLWTGSEGRRRTVRVCPVVNADRGWIVTALRVADGPAAAVTSSARGQTRGVLHVEIDCDGRTIRLDFQPDRIERR